MVGDALGKLISTPKVAKAIAASPAVTRADVKKELFPKTSEYFADGNELFDSLVTS